MVAIRTGSKKKGKRSTSAPITVMPSLSRTSLTRSRSYGGGRGICSVRVVLLVVLVFFLMTVSWKVLSYWKLEVPDESSSSGSDFKFYTFDVVNEYDHDSEAFTQGLLYAGNNTLFESTGLNGRSSVRKVHLGTGKVEALHKMGNSWFGEGLTLVGDRLFQVTWLQQTGFVYARDNLSQIGSFKHQMKDGWGLATDGKILFGSDGTSSLYEINPQTFQVTKRVTVRYRGQEVLYLNELEYVHSEVWANVWQTDCIARISRKDGTVLSWILLHQLRQHLMSSGHNGIDVLNGIAWDDDNKRLFVTGKLWPKLYEIKLRPIRRRLQGNIDDLCPLR